MLQTRHCLASFDPGRLWLNLACLSWHTERGGRRPGPVRLLAVAARPKDHGAAHGARGILCRHHCQVAGAAPAGDQGQLPGPARLPGVRRARCPGLRRRVAAELRDGQVRLHATVASICMQGPCCTVLCDMVHLEAAFEHACEWLAYFAYFFQTAPCACKVRGDVAP